MLQHSGFASANTLKPLAGLHKRALKLTLLKSTSLTAHDYKVIAGLHKRALKLTLLKSTSLTAHNYKVLDVLPLKLNLEFNKSITAHRTVTGYAPSTLKFNFHLNQNRHSHKLMVPRPSLDLFKCSLMYSEGNLWNGLNFYQTTKHLKRHLNSTLVLYGKITTNID